MALPPTQTQKKQKVVVYFPTAHHAAHMSRLIKKTGLDVLDIHNEVYKDIEEENRKKLRDAKKAVVFTIDPHPKNYKHKWLDPQETNLVIQVYFTHPLSSLITMPIFNHVLDKY